MKEQRVPSSYHLVTQKCPCYCGGEGVLMLVVCPHCRELMARCDEVDELIRDIHNPQFVGEDSICHPDQLCPKCGLGRYGEFRPATEAEIQAGGFINDQYRRWR